MRRIATIVTSLGLIAAGAFVIPSLSQAAAGTGVYGSWSLTDPASATITFPGTIFPGATVTSSGETLQLATSATLGASTPFGLAYGPSNGKQYLSAALASGKPSGTVTITFDTPPAPGTYGFALGDIDAENIKITATGKDGQALSVAEWLGSTFNYSASGTDLPNWDASTGVLTGNGVDTDGASLFFVASDEVKSITFEQVRSSGFPRFQLWIAADVITAKPVPSPTATAAIIPTAPDGKVVICHRTNSRNNPYVQIIVSQDSIDKKNGHDTHDGPIFPAANWGDIIPPFTGYAGQNWPAGAAVLNNGCEVGGEQLVATSASASPSSSSASPTASSAGASASTSASASDSALASATSTSSASATASESASPSPTASASASESASATASASASASASPSASATTSSSASPSASATVSESASASESPVVPTLLRIDPEDPQPLPVDPEKPTAIDPGPGNTVTEVGDPTHGTVVVRDGDVIYTPEPGYVGEVEVPITITDRDGNVMAATVTLNVGEKQTAVTTLPSTLKVGTNVLLAKPVVTNAKQRATVDVACRPLMRIGKMGDATLCSTWVANGRTYLRVNAPAKVVVAVSAPKQGAFGPFDFGRTYLVK